jgi:tetratricopeptide (TPR) repeat protein
MKKGVVMGKRCFMLIAALLSSLLIVYGCGEDDGGGGQTVEELIEQGWAKFEAGNYSGACGDFKAAIGLSADTNEAYLGLGWAELRQNHAGLAEGAFETYVAKDPGSNDAKAGLALAYHAQVKFEDAIDMAEDVFSSDPSWSFSSHALSINYLDLALILAESYYETADFNQSLLLVQQYFDPNFVVDPNTAEGRTQLGIKLESLYTG